MRKEGEEVQQGAAATGNLLTGERKHMLGGLWRPAVSEGISKVETQLNYRVRDNFFRLQNDLDRCDDPRPGRLQPGCPLSVPPSGGDQVMDSGERAWHAGQQLLMKS